MFSSPSAEVIFQLFSLFLPEKNDNCVFDFVIALINFFLLCKIYFIKISQFFTTFLAFQKILKKFA